jgi:glycosyltransferase involved in cell wall biosynthesis
MMNEVPFVSVIIPTYNRGNQLKICLEKLCEQTFKNFEVIVCDDGSTDNTPQIVAEFKTKLNLQYIQDDNFGGPAKPRNNGLKIAKGNIVAFLDSDDWWYANKLEEAIKYIEDYDVVYHNLDKYKTLDKPSGLISNRQLGANAVKDLIINGGIPNSSVVIKKAIIDKIGFITEDKSFIAVEDSDYWIRAAQVTNKFYYINKRLGAYWVGDNISVSHKQIDRDTALFNKHEYLLDDSERKQALQLLALKKARVYHKMGKFAEAKKEYTISFNSSNLSIKVKSIIGFVTSMFTIKA